MTSQEFDEPGHGRKTIESTGGDHAQPGLLRQLGNGIGGLVVLLLTGLILMIVVLWKSP